MSEVKSHAPGAFCWIELNTCNVAAAKKFYGELFDWQADDSQAGPDMVYTMLKMRGMEVGAMCELQKEQKEQNVPPHWMSYIAVKSADEAAHKAEALGGVVLAGAFDVMDAGRMAIIQDPLGAHFCVWQARDNVGFQLAGENGTFVWDELWTTDRTKATAFYSGLFGWGAKESAAGVPGGYTEWQNASQSIGGMMELTPEMGPIPSNWLPYFMVDDCNATAAKAVQVGGKLVMPPTDIPNVGRFSVIQDLQGATFAVIKLLPRE
jgi:predicted enzyme related to lactoylglutathione lyase